MFMPASGSLTLRRASRTASSFSDPSSAGRSLESTIPQPNLEYPSIRNGAPAPGHVFVHALCNRHKARDDPKRSHQPTAWHVAKELSGSGCPSEHGTIRPDEMHSHPQRFHRPARHGCRTLVLKRHHLHSLVPIQDTSTLHPPPAEPTPTIVDQCRVLWWTRGLGNATSAQHEGLAPHTSRRKATAASATSPRTRLSVVIDRPLGENTRLVRRMTNRSWIGSIQIDVPVYPVCPKVADDIFVPVLSLSVVSRICQPSARLPGPRRLKWSTMPGRNTVVPSTVPFPNHIRAYTAMSAPVL